MPNQVCAYAECPLRDNNYIFWARATYAVVACLYFLGVPSGFTPFSLLLLIVPTILDLLDAHAPGFVPKMMKIILILLNVYAGIICILSLTPVVAFSVTGRQFSLCMSKDSLFLPNYILLGHWPMIFILLSSVAVQVALACGTPNKKKMEKVCK